MDSIRLRTVFTVLAGPQQTRRSIPEAISSVTDGDTRIHTHTHTVSERPNEPYTALIAMSADEALLRQPQQKY